MHGLQVIYADGLGEINMSPSKHQLLLVLLQYLVTKSDFMGSMESAGSMLSEACLLLLTSVPPIGSAFELGLLVSSSPCGSGRPDVMFPEASFLLLLI